MNEHIRKCCDGAGLDSNWKPGFDSIYGQQLEKFAELIVQECAKICDELQKWPSTEPRHCANDIRIHFGVEE